MGNNATACQSEDARKVDAAPSSGIISRNGRGVNVALKRETQALLSGGKLGEARLERFDFFLQRF